MFGIEYTSGLTVSVTVTADPGGGSSWISGDPVILWGDGSTTTSVLNGRAYSHTYSSYGTYTIMFEGENECGGICGDEKSITLVEAAIDVTIVDWTLQSSVNLGDTIVTNVTVKNNSSTEEASIKALVSGTNTTTGYPLSSGYVGTTIPASTTVGISCPIDVPADADLGTYQLTPTMYALDDTLLAIGTSKTVAVVEECPEVTITFPNTPEISFNGTTATCRIYVNAGAGETVSRYGTSILAYDGSNWIELADQLDLLSQEQTVDLTWEMTAGTDWCMVGGTVINSCGASNSKNTSYYKYTECPVPTCSFRIN